MMFSYKSTESLNFIFLDFFKVFYLKVSISALPLNILFLCNFAQVHKINSTLRTHVVTG